MTEDPNRRPSPVAESTPTDATAVEAEREACAKVNYAAAGAPQIPTSPSDYELAEVVIGNWCVRGDKRKTRQLIAEGIALARTKES